MRRGLSGHYLPIRTVGEAARAFVPAPLPPAPALEIDGELGGLLDAASTALGRLDGISLLLPDPGLFLYTYIRKEAVLSSQIESTQSSLSDLLSHELDSTPSKPARCSKPHSRMFSSRPFSLPQKTPR